MTLVAPRERARGPALAACAAGLALAVLGAVLLLGSPASVDTGFVPAARPTPVAGDGSIRNPAPADPVDGPRGEAETPRSAPSPPARLELPGSSLSAPVIPVVVVTGGALTVPDDPNVLGWWSAGALPGGGEGSVVIDGHVDSARLGPGIFARLRELEPGDLVLVTSVSGETRRYRITGRRQFTKAELPADVFSQDVQERLVLITCGGTFDPVLRQYADNVVVFAVPAGTPG